MTTKTRPEPALLRTREDQQAWREANKSALLAADVDLCRRIALMDSRGEAHSEQDEKMLAELLDRRKLEPVPPTYEGIDQDAQVLRVLASDEARRLLDDKTYDADCADLEAAWQAAQKAWTDAIYALPRA